MRLALCRRERVQGLHRSRCHTIPHTTAHPRRSRIALAGMPPARVSTAAASMWATSPPRASGTRASTRTARGRTWRPRVPRLRSTRTSRFSLASPSFHCLPSLPGPRRLRTAPTASLPKTRTALTRAPTSATTPGRATRGRPAPCSSPPCPAHSTTPRASPTPAGATSSAATVSALPKAVTSLAATSRPCGLCTPPPPAHTTTTTLFPPSRQGWARTHFYARASQAFWVCQQRPCVHMQGKLV